MKLTFVSNYINHHQIPFCNVLYETLKDDFTFIQMQAMEAERVQLGWGLDELPEYVKCAYKESQYCAELVMESDIVIWGGVEDETMLHPRLQAGKPVIRYSERLYREGQWKAISPRGLRKKYLDHTRYRKSPVYLLCAGAYVASDFHIVRAYPGKMFKWGYFPELIKYDVDKLMAEKTKEEILWAGRFIDCKRPQMVVEIAKELLNAGKNFHITMLGDGELRPLVEQDIEKAGLQAYITLVGYKKPHEVRTAMEKACIFLMTSNRIEGWGAVINEAMNSGCAVIADRMEGAPLFLIKQGENGYWCYKPTGKSIATLVETLLDDKTLCEEIGRKAYETIADTWNAEVAGERLLTMCEVILRGEEPKDLWLEGPGSRAEIIPERIR